MPAHKKAVPPHELGTPMLDKLAAARDDGSEAIGAFLEWLLGERGVKLAAHATASFTCHTCGTVPAREVVHVSWLSSDEARWRHKAAHCEKPQAQIRAERSIPIDQYEGDEVDHVPDGLYPAARASIDQLLNEYFEIDEAAVERERRDLLAELRGKVR
jgi:hypothetical protein